jgi:hypothetical protein
MRRRMRRVREVMKTLTMTRMTNPNPIIKKNDLFVLFVQMDICFYHFQKPTIISMKFEEFQQYSYSNFKNRIIKS